MKRQLTVTISAELGRYVDEQARERKTTKSAVVEQALACYMKARFEELLREGYLEMAEADRQFLEEWGPV